MISKKSTSLKLDFFNQENSDTITKSATTESSRNRSKSSSVAHQISKLIRSQTTRKTAHSETCSTVATSEFSWNATKPSPPDSTNSAFISTTITAIVSKSNTNQSGKPTDFTPVNKPDFKFPCLVPKHLGSTTEPGQIPSNESLSSLCSNDKIDSAQLHNTDWNSFQNINLMKNTKSDRNSDDSYFNNNPDQLLKHFNEEGSDEIMKKKSV